MKIYLCGQKAFGAAALAVAIKSGHDVAGVSAPLTSSRNPAKPDRLRAAAASAGIPVMPPGMISADTLPDGTDLILAAHSHDFIGRRTRLAASIGAIGYHPPLLPLHRGRDSVRWAIKMGERVTGGSIYWLGDTIDAGDIAAQDYCLIEPGETPEDLWREKLFPMGLRLFAQALTDIDAGHIIAVPQDDSLATWEPSWERQPLRRPDLLMIGPGLDGLKVHRDASALRH